MGPMWLGAEVTWSRGDSVAEVTGAEVSGAEVVGAEVTRGRGGSGAEVSVNLWYHVKCLGHDNSVTQHNKREHWAPCRNQTTSWLKIFWKRR